MGTKAGAVDIWRRQEKRRLYQFSLVSQQCRTACSTPLLSLAILHIGFGHSLNCKSCYMLDETADTDISFKCAGVGVEQNPGSLSQLCFSYVTLKNSIMFILVLYSITVMDVHTKRGQSFK